MSLRIYLAGAIRELERCKAWAEMIRNCDRTELSHDWIAKVDAAVAAGKLRDRDLEEALRRELAEDDLDGIRSADLVWLLAPAEKGVGCWVELGYSLATERRIVVSGDHERSIFCSLADVTTREDAVAWAGIYRLAREVP